MLNGCEVLVGFEGDAAQALELAERELSKLGYQRKTLESGKLVMKFGGALFTSDPNKMRHAVTVLPRQGALCFQFGTGIVASYWTDSDRAWAQQRADDIVGAIRASLAS